MKVIVAGGRDCTEHNFIFGALDRRFADFKDPYLRPVQDIVVVSGGAKGADAIGEEWAVVNWTGLKVFPADWDRYGKSAGAIRNKEMAEYADVLMAFWDGQSKGTKNMINTAMSYGLEVHVYRYTNKDKPND